jgi:hypothetical protein
MLGPELPQLGAHVWDWFWKLHIQRQGTGFSAQAITWEAIDAFVRNRLGFKPDGWEIDGILALDAAWRIARTKVPKKRSDD